MIERTRARAHRALAPRDAHEDGQQKKSDGGVVSRSHSGVVAICPVLCFSFLYSSSSVDVDFFLLFVFFFLCSSGPIRRLRCLRTCVDVILWPFRVRKFGYGFPSRSRAECGEPHRVAERGEKAGGGKVMEREEEEAN